VPARSVSVLVLILVLATVAGCGTTPPPAPTDSVLAPAPKDAPSTPVQSGPSAEARLASYRAAVDAAAARSMAAARTPEERSLVEADLAFSALAREAGAPEAFARQMLPDGKTFPAGEPPAVGPDAVRAALEGAGTQWWWAPEEVRVSGDLGVTWGVAAIGVTTPDGKADAVQTRYVSVWRRDPDGRWKLWLDIGNRGPGLGAP